MNLSMAVVYHGIAGLEKRSWKSRILTLKRGNCGPGAREQVSEMQGRAESETGLKGLGHGPLSRPSVLSKIPWGLYIDVRGRPTLCGA